MAANAASHGTGGGLSDQIQLQPRITREKAARREVGRLEDGRCDHVQLLTAGIGWLLGEAKQRFEWTLR